MERVWHIMRVLRLLSEYFGDRIFFGGGAVVNYVYLVKVGEPPRLTFDLDSAWCKRVRSKRVLLAEITMFNRWLAEQGLTLLMPTPKGGAAELYVAEYDV